MKRGPTLVAAAAFIAIVGCAPTAPDLSRPSSSCPAPVGRNGNPIPLLRPTPYYPLAALEQGIEGRVLLEFDISRSGHPVRVEAVAAEPEGVFEEAALEMMSRWRYCPLEDSEPDYPSRIRFALLFNLPDDDLR